MEVPLRQAGSGWVRRGNGGGFEVLREPIFFGQRHLTLWHQSLRSGMLFVVSWVWIPNASDLRICQAEYSHSPAQLNRFRVPFLAEGYSCNYEIVLVVISVGCLYNPAAGIGKGDIAGYALSPPCAGLQHLGGSPIQPGRRYRKHDVWRPPHRLHAPCSWPSRRGGAEEDRSGRQGT